MTKPQNYLLAIDGDCSAGAMSEHADVIPIEKYNKELIENFLRAQNELTIASHFYDLDSPYALKKHKEYYAVCEKLKLINFFGGQKNIPASACCNIPVSLYESPAEITCKLSLWSAFTALVFWSCCLSLYPEISPLFSMIRL